MLRSVEKLVNAYKDGKKKMTTGNHRLEVDNNGIARFYYHWTAICTVDPNKGTITYDNGGWNTSSTNRALSSYRQAFN